jgi:hypothetical protein
VLTFSLDGPGPTWATGGLAWASTMGGNRGRGHGVEWGGGFDIFVMVNIEIILFKNVLGATAGKGFHLTGGFNCGIVGLGHPGRRHLVGAGGEEGPGLQGLEAADPGVDITTGGRMEPGPTQVPSICIGGLTGGLAGRGLGR